MFFETPEQNRETTKRRRETAIRTFAARTSDLLVAVTHGAKADVTLTKEESCFCGDIIQELKKSGYETSATYRHPSDHPKMAPLEGDAVIFNCHISISLATRPKIE